MAILCHICSNCRYDACSEVAHIVQLPCSVVSGCVILLSCCTCTCTMYIATVSHNYIHYSCMACRLPESIGYSCMACRFPESISVIIILWLFHWASMLSLLWCKWNYQYRKVVYKSRGLSAVFWFFGRLIFKTGLYSRQAYVQCCILVVVTVTRSHTAHKLYTAPYTPYTFSV